MDVTEVRIRLVQDNNAEKLCAFATITLDNEFVVRDMKVIDGNNGLFVAMPSRKVMERCRKCGAKNPARASYCNECGGRIQVSRRYSDSDGRSKMHVDVAHPVTSSCRERIHNEVIKSYKEALERSQQPAGSADTPLDQDTGEDIEIETEVSPASEQEAPRQAKEAPQSSQQTDSGGWQIFS